MPKFTLLLLTLFSTSVLFAQSFFVLTGLKSYDPVVSLALPKVSKEVKPEIMQMMQTMSKTLGVDTAHHSSRALAFDIKNFSVGATIAIKMDLIMGETVLREDDKEQVYALSYLDSRMFVPDELDDDIIDNAEEMLEKFLLQYQEDNQETALSNVELTHDNFASKMNYETDYATALAKAKKEKKPLMVLMTTNFCPWCRKFEKRLLSQNVTAKKIQEKFIPLVLNLSEKKFPEALGKIAMTPTVYIVNENNETLSNQFVGYSARDEFLYMLNH